MAGGRLRSDREVRSAQSARFDERGNHPPNGCRALRRPDGLVDRARHSGGSDREGVAGCAGRRRRRPCVEESPCSSRARVANHRIGHHGCWHDVARLHEIQRDQPQQPGTNARTEGTGISAGTRHTSRFVVHRLLIVDRRRVQLSLRLPVEIVPDHLLRSWSRARTRSIAVSPSTISAEPSSTSRARRSTISAHFSAAPASGSPSRLRMRSRASSARCCSDSRNACSRM